jgi:hypothetical protein
MVAGLTMIITMVGITAVLSIMGHMVEQAAVQHIILQRAHMLEALPDTVRAEVLLPHRHIILILIGMLLKPVHRLLMAHGVERSLLMEMTGRVQATVPIGREL